MEWFRIPKLPWAARAPGKGEGRKIILEDNIGPMVRPGCSSHKSPNGTHFLEYVHTILRAGNKIRKFSCGYCSGAHFA